MLPFSFCTHFQLSVGSAIYDDLLLLSNKQNATKHRKQDNLRFVQLNWQTAVLNCDSLTELMFYVPLDTEQVISDTFLPANLLAWYGRKETRPTQQQIYC